MAPITQAEVDSIAADCSGSVASIGDVEYVHVKIKAKLYLCNIDSESSTTLLALHEATGRVVDLEQARADDASQYMAHGRVPDDLRALVGSGPPDARYKVDVWYRADFDEVVDKDDATTQAIVNAALSSHLRAAAEELIAEVAKLPDLQVVSDKSTFEHLPIPLVTIEGTGKDLLLLAESPLGRPPRRRLVGCWFTAAVNWAVGKGANVFSRSGRCDCVSDWPHLPTCTNPGRLLDYVATVSPYPLVACASGNALPVSQGGDGEGSDEDSKAAVYNGIGVTGAEPDTASRAALTRYVPGQTQNRVGGANGWELPGIAAPARNLDTAGMNPGQVDQVSATSAATPVVAGIAASMMELNPAVKVRPEVLIPGLMVSADENVDDDLGGVWPMNLHDGRDDHDGAGVVNAVGAYWVLRPAAKMNGGNTAVPYGHDFGGVTSAGLPQGQWYGEIWNASVPAGATLRVGLMLMAKVTCGSPATQTNCNPQTHPFAWLAFTRNGSSVSGSANAYNNIQFAGYKNTSGRGDVQPSGLWQAVEPTRLGGMPAVGVLGRR